MPEQLSLFGDENTLFNTGVQQLFEMDFRGCVETLTRYFKLFPWGREPSKEISISEFWLENLGSGNRAEIDPVEAERRYLLWLEFEEAFGHPWPGNSIERSFQARYFSRIADGLLAQGGHVEAAKLPGGTLTGLIYLLAGRADPAITSLQALIAAEPGKTRVYGYLGDAYALRGDLHTARICYREAFAMGPGQVDIAHLYDSELRERLEALEREESVENDPLGWFPVIAHLDGFFERRIFRELEELREWLKHYLELLKIYGRDEDKAHVPQLFYHAMVISDNASIMKFIKKVDLIQVRQSMKEWHPALFARYMRQLEKMGSRPKRHP
jgi:tetratricopeptide (TPR) repeat protein